MLALEVHKSFYVHRGPYLMTREQMFQVLNISQRTFNEMTDPKSDKYDPDFPKPCKLFTGKKLRYSSVDVDAYILKLSNAS